MRLTELPLGLAGRAFRCAMPFSPYDPQGRALDEFRDRGVSVVVVLAEADECERLEQLDLRQLYRDEGFEVVEFPIRNFGVTGEARLREVVDRVLARPAGTSPSIVMRARGGPARSRRVSREGRSISMGTRRSPG